MLVVGTRVRLIAALVTTSLLAACDRQITPAFQSEPAIGLLPTPSEGSAFIQSEQRHYVRASGGVTTGKALDTSTAWTLEHALSGGGGHVQGGDTIFLLGGTYLAQQASGGRFTSTLSGASWSSFITVREFPGRIAILDGAGLTTDGQEVLRVTGSYVEFRGLFIRDTDAGSGRTNQRPHLVVNAASHTRYRNLVIHDGGDAFYNFPAYSDVTIEGCVLYNNGFRNDPLPDHALYLRSNASASGPVIARHNIIFNQFGYGVHAYSDVSSENVNYVYLDSNVVFNNGSLGSTGKANIIVGVGSSSLSSAGNRLIGNMTYKSSGVSGSNLLIGYAGVNQGSVTVTGNYVAQGSWVLDSRFWTSASYSNNTFIGSSSMVSVQDTGGVTWSNNTHYRTPTAGAWYFETSRTFSSWQTAVAAGTDQATGATPANQTFVRGVYPGRVNVVLYNWSNAGSFSFTPPTSHFQAGDSIEVRHAYRLYGSPVKAGRCCSSMSITLASDTAPVPYGMSVSDVPLTGNSFAAFVVTRVETPASTEPPAATSLTVRGAMIAQSPYTSTTVVPQGGYCEFQVNAVNPVTDATITLFWNGRQDSIVGSVGDAFYPAMLSSGTMIFEMRASKAGYTSVWSPTLTIYTGSGATCLL